MSLAKYIFTADDFGPIDFINESVFEHVRQGNINSVHVLANMEGEKLKTNLEKLADMVPSGKVLDLGVHLTLSSGSPLYMRDSSIKDYTDAWGNMLYRNHNVDGQWNQLEFYDFARFYVSFLKKDYMNQPQYSMYLPAIKEEFRTQVQLLKSLVMQVNSGLEQSKLKVTSVSNHHNLLLIHQKLFEICCEVAEDEELAVRSPKAFPGLPMKLFYGLIFPLGNPLMDGELRRNMKKLNKSFSNYNYYKGGKDICIKSPTYLDISYYMQIGSKFNKSWRGKKNRLKKIEGAIEDAERNHSRNKNVRATNVEIVFHLGNRPANNNQSYTDMVQGYPGVEPKYFNNRKLEHEGLFHWVKRNPSQAAEIKGENFISWDQCDVLSYKVGN